MVKKKNEIEIEGCIYTYKSNIKDKRLVTKELGNVTGVSTPISTGSTQSTGVDFVVRIADSIRNIGPAEEPDRDPRLGELGDEDTTSGGSEGGSIGSIVGFGNATARIVVGLVVA